MSSWMLSLQSTSIFREMSILSKRNLRKQLTATQEVLPFHQQQWLMQIGQWRISKSRGKFDTSIVIFKKDACAWNISLKSKFSSAYEFFACTFPLYQKPLQSFSFYSYAYGLL